jgi:LysR family glycine cleavage system transcriptional activator
MNLPFRAISVFHAAARVGSISRAAQDLGVTPSAVSQQIGSLETQLGISLMVKAGRRVVLTEAGERYFAMITDEIERISDATDRIRGFRSPTALDVRVTPSVATKWLLPRLGKFLAAHRDLEIHIDATNEPSNFSREDVDLEIRHGEGRWPGVFVEGLAEERFMPVCAPSLCPAGSVEAADLPNYRLIHSVKSQLTWNSWFTTTGVTPNVRWQRVLFDRAHMAIDAAVDGMGIALESTLLMSRELDEGKLVCPVQQPPRIALTTLWIVCPHGHLRQRKVRAFLDWLRGERQAWAMSREDVDDR